MAISAAGPRRLQGDSRDRAPGLDREDRASFADALVLTVVLAGGIFAIVLALVMLAVHPTPYPAPLAGEQRQSAETGLYLLTFAAILPLSLILGPRLADSIARGPNGRALPALSALLAGSFALAVLIARGLDQISVLTGVGGVLAVFGIWAAGAVAVLARAREARAWRPLAGAARLQLPAWALTGLLIAGSLLALTALRSVSLAPLGLAAAAAITVLGVHGRSGLPTPPRRVAIAADAAIVALLLLAVPDLVIFQPELAPSDPAVAYETAIIGFHQNFILGPANEVLAGGAALVDTASQYGVGPIYLAAGWSKLTSTGYGMFGLLDGLLTALFYAAGYGLLRLGGCSRLLAGSTLAVGVVALIYNLSFSVGALPQQGPLRFGLPMILIVVMLAGARFPRRERIAELAGLAVVGLASVWAFEAFVYAALTFAAITAFRTWERGASGGRRWALRRGLEALGACIAVHLAFALATIGASGHLPDWGQYLAFLQGFLFGHLGDLTYDFAHWSPGLGVGAAYLISAAAVVLLIRRHAELARSERVAMLALSATTGYGIALFSYFVDRSGSYLLPYVSLPAVLIGALWLSLLLRAEALPARVCRGGLAFALAVATLLVATAWSAVGDHFARSALAHVAPGGRSFRDAVRRLGDPPPLDTRAPVGEALLARYMPGDGPALVLALPDLETEILIRSGRGSELPLSDPWEDSFVYEEHLASLGAAIDDLRPGDLMLMDSGALSALSLLREHPRVNVFEHPQSAGKLAPLQEWALRRIDRRFRLVPVGGAADGFVVVRLAARGARFVSRR